MKFGEEGMWSCSVVDGDQVVRRVPCSGGSVWALSLERAGGHEEVSGCKPGV